jgi:hypothetical protein
VNEATHGLISLLRSIEKVQTEKEGVFDYENFHYQRSETTKELIEIINEKLDTTMQN